MIRTLLTVTSLLLSCALAAAQAEAPLDKCRSEPSVEKKVICIMNWLDAEAVTKKSIEVVRFENKIAGCAAIMNKTQPTPSSVINILCDNGNDQRWKIHLSQ